MRLFSLILKLHHEVWLMWMCSRIKDFCWKLKRWLRLTTAVFVKSSYDLAILSLDFNMKMEERKLTLISHWNTLVLNINISESLFLSWDGFWSLANDEKMNYFDISPHNCISLFSVLFVKFWEPILRSQMLPFFLKRLKYFFLIFLQMIFFSIKSCLQFIQFLKDSYFEIVFSLPPFLQTHTQTQTCDLWFVIWNTNFKNKE